MVYIFFDLGFVVLIFLIAIIAGGGIGSTGLYNFLDSNLLTAITIFVIIHLILLIIVLIKFFYKNTVKQKTALVLGNLLYTVGKIIRIVTETCFIACLFKGFLMNYQSCDNFFDKGLALFVFLLDFLLVGITSSASGFIDWCTIQIYDLMYHEDPYFKKYEHTNEETYEDLIFSTLIIGIISIVLSIILFLLVEFLISHGYSSPAEALFKDVPILNNFFKDVSILGKIFKS